MSFLFFFESCFNDSVAWMANISHHLFAHQPLPGLLGLWGALQEENAAVEVCSHLPGPPAASESVDCTPSWTACDDRHGVLPCVSLALASDPARITSDRRRVCWAFSTMSSSLPHQLGGLQFNSILTPSTWSLGCHLCFWLTSCKSEVPMTPLGLD